MKKKISREEYSTGTGTWTGEGQREERGEKDTREKAGRGRQRGGARGGFFDEIYCASEVF